MESGLNHIRQTIIPNLERPGGTGKVKLTESERKVFLEARSDMLNFPLYFGAGAFGLNYAITYPLRNSRMKWIRVPLNLLAGGFGVSFGFNKALEKLLVNLYSLPDSNIAKEGRELLQKKDPSNPLLKTINTRMAQRTVSSTAQALGSTSTGSEWKEEEVFQDDPNTQVASTSMLSVADAAKELRPAATTSSSIGLGSSFQTVPKNDGPEKQFHGEDALSLSGWESTPVKSPPQTQPPVESKPTLATQKSSGRTWDEVRAEYQRRKSQS